MRGCTTEADLNGFHFFSVNVFGVSVKFVYKKAAECGVRGVGRSL